VIEAGGIEREAQLSSQRFLRDEASSKAIQGRCT